MDEAACGVALSIIWIGAGEIGAREKIGVIPEFRRSETCFFALITAWFYFRIST